MTFTPMTYASAVAEHHRLRKSRRRFWFSVAAALAFILAAGCAGGTTDSPVQPNPPAPAVSTQAALPAIDGLYFLLPGTYRTTERARTPACRWARLRDFSGERTSTVAYGWVEVGTRGQLVVKRDDAAVELTGGCVWNRVAK